MRFIFAHDGTAVNVAHIVTISIQTTSKGDGHVVRCTTVLLNGEYVTQGALITLTPVFTDREAAETALKLITDTLSPR